MDRLELIARVAQTTLFSYYDRQDIRETIDTIYHLCLPIQDDTLVDAVFKAYIIGGTAGKAVPILRDLGWKLKYDGCRKEEGADIIPSDISDILYYHCCKQLIPTIVAKKLACINKSFPALEIQCAELQRNRKVNIPEILDSEPGYRTHSFNHKNLDTYASWENNGYYIYNENGELLQPRIDYNTEVTL